MKRLLKRRDHETEGRRLARVIKLLEKEDTRGCHEVDGLREGQLSELVPFRGERKPGMPRNLEAEKMTLLHYLIRTLVHLPPPAVKEEVILALERATGRMSPSSVAVRDSEGRTALAMAIENVVPERAVLTLVSAMDTEGILLPGRHGIVPLQRLISHCEDPRWDNAPSIMAAMLDRLGREGIHQRSSDGETALHWFAKVKHKKVSLKLLGMVLEVAPFLALSVTAEGESLLWRLLAGPLHETALHLVATGMLFAYGMDGVTELDVLEFIVPGDPRHWSHHGETTLGLFCSQISRGSIERPTALLSTLLQIVPEPLVQSDATLLCQLFHHGVTVAVAECAAMLAPLCTSATHGPSTLSVHALAGVGGLDSSQCEVYCDAFDTLVSHCDDDALAATTSVGETILHVSVKSLNIEAVRRLVVLLPKNIQGARDSNGRTALEVAHSMLFSPRYSDLEQRKVLSSIVDLLHSSPLCKAAQ